MGLNQIGGVARSGSNAWQNGLQYTIPQAAAWVVPSGNWYITLGPYTSLQYFDSLANLWRAFQTGPTSDPVVVASDGVNYRVKNSSATIVSAVITAAGSGMNNGVYQVSSQSGVTSTLPGGTTPLTAFTEAGGGSPTRRATWNMVIGGAISTTVTITAAGANYGFTGVTSFTNVPTLLASDPPSGGVRATAVVASLTAAGGIASVTVTNQGAGYTTAPTWTVIPAQGDTAGTGAILTSTLVGSGTITALYCTENGSGYTAVPTITMTGGGSPTATVVTCLTVTAVAAATVTGMSPTTGVYPCQISAGYTAGTPIYVNPSISTGIYTPQAGLILANVTSATAMTFGNGITATNTFPIYGGLHQAAPTVAASFGLYATYTPGAITLGGATDTFWAVPA